MNRNCHFFTFVSLFLLFQSHPICGYSQRVHVYTYTDTVHFGPGDAAGKIFRAPSPRNSPNSTAQASHSKILSNLQVTAVVTPSSCGEASGSITFNATGGTPPYLFAFGNRQVFQSSSYLPVPGPGVDTAWVMDATGALAYTLVTMGNTYAPVYPYNASQTAPTDCTTPDGQITAGVNGGTPPFSYSLDEINYQSSPTFSSLHPGYYYIFVKDANGCQGSISFLLPSPRCQFISDQIGSITCTNTGKLLMLPDARIPQPVQYSLDGVNYQSSPNFFNLTAGQYLVYAIDGNGQKYVVSAYVYPYCELAMSGVEIDATCGSKNGSLTIQGVNGFPPYQYSIDGVHFQLTGNFTGLSDGAYTVLVRDGSGRIAANLFIIASGCPSVTAAATAALCGNANGSITAFPGSIGTPPFQYSIDGVNFQSSGTFNNLAAGPYTVTIKDANNYTGFTTVVVTNTCLTITANIAPAHCNQADGGFVVNVTGGTSPYSYSIDGVNFQASGTFTGLAASAYTVTVKDAAGNIGSAPTAINNLAGPTVATQSTAATCAGNDGTIAMQPTGGTAPYSFSLDNVNWQASGTFTGLNTGTYVPYVKDASGCPASVTATVALNNNLILNLDGQDSICQGGSMTWGGSSDATQFIWSPTTGLNNPNILLPTATPAQTTTYTLTATRGACQTQALWTIAVNPTPQLTVSPDTTICYGQSVQLNATVTSGGDRPSGSTTYSWSPSTNLNNPNIANPVVESPEQTASYQLTATDPDGCKSIEPATVTIHVTPPAKLSAGDDTSVLAGTPIQLAAIDVNHSGFTTYSWTPTTGLTDPSIASPVADLDANITYTISAETPAGCQGTANLTLKVYHTIDLVVPGAFTPNGDGHNDVLKIISLGMKNLQYFAVFNRWGQRVFYTTDTGKGWNGTINGQPQAAGVYVWMAEGIDVKGDRLQRKGTVTLIR